MDLLLKQNMLLMVRALFFCMEEQWEKLGRNFDLTPAQQHILYYFRLMKERFRLLKLVN